MRASIPKDGSKCTTVSFFTLTSEWGVHCACVCVERDSDMHVCVLRETVRGYCVCTCCMCMCMWCGVVCLAGERIPRRLLRSDYTGLIKPP